MIPELLGAILGTSLPIYYALKSEDSTETTGEGE